jgi:hypothetical protein
MRSEGMSDHPPVSDAATPTPVQLLTQRDLADRWQVSERTLERRNRVCAGSKSAPPSGIAWLTSRPLRPRRPEAVSSDRAN